MKLPRLITPELQRRTNRLGFLIGMAGGVITVVAPFLPWAWDGDALDDMTVAGYPSPLQFIALAFGVLIVGLLLATRLIKRQEAAVAGRLGPWCEGRGRRSAGVYRLDPAQHRGRARRPGERRDRRLDRLPRRSARLRRH